ncbi:MAG: glutathione S-transferase family protein [Pseudomonadales bacterium]|nr:glutathione S-transferase family protein [Halioglobus sp.]MCP5193778.1 glutathione S-transferase family protein [Pseudomonadales bacterium]
MYSLHIANKNYSSWSLRPWVLMRALDIPFDEVMHPFADTGNREAFRQFSPTARVPCLVDAAQTVWDSLAIAEYLAETHPQVWPRDRAARAWARCASAEMHSGFNHLRNECSMSCGQRIALYNASPGLGQDLARIDELWSEGRDRFGGPFLAGREFTAVDAFFAPVVFRVQSYQLALSSAAQDYLQLMLSLPAMAAWYESALLETWREAVHEQEIANSGDVIADYRAG